MSSLKERNEQLAEAIEQYPDLIRSLLSFITEPSVVKLIEAGGQSEGSLVFNVKKGQIVSFVPQLELKLGFEITR